MSNSTVGLLKQVLAESYSLRLMTQNYHWNVEGERFVSLHNLFEEQYDELAEAIDEIAERIRALGEKAPGSYAEFDKLSTLKSPDSSLDANGMLASLRAAHSTLVETLQKAMAAAQDDGDEATADMMIARQQVHQKTIWMFNSLLKGTSAERQAA